MRECPAGKKKKDFSLTKLVKIVSEFVQYIVVNFRVIYQTDQKMVVGLITQHKIKNHVTVFRRLTWEALLSDLEYPLL